MTAQNIIDKLGGFRGVAASLGIPATTVHSWQRRNAIPNWRHSSLLQLAMVKGVRLSTTDFPENERAVA